MLEAEAIQQIGHTVTIPSTKQREKLRSKGKSCTKTNSCNPKVNVTEKSSKEGFKGQFRVLEVREALQLQSSSS